MELDYAQECGQERISARMVVVTPLHGYYLERCYLVRSDQSGTIGNHKYLLEVIGQPECRAWFAANEVMDMREYTEHQDRAAG